MHAARATVMAYGGVLWLQVAFGSHAGHGHGDLPWLGHWVRDATLALPAVVVGVVVAERVFRGLRVRTRLQPAVEACALAGGAAVALALTSPFHALLMGERLQSLADLTIHAREVLVAALPPLILVSLLASAVGARRRQDGSLFLDGLTGRVVWALLGGVAIAAVSVTGNVAQSGGVAGARAAGTAVIAASWGRDGAAALLVGFLVVLAMTLLLGTPWEPARFAVAARRRGSAVPRLRVAVASAIALTLPLIGSPPLQAARAQEAEHHPPFACERTIIANVVALDQDVFYNRLGVVSEGGMMYALRRDVVVKSGSDAGESEAEGATLEPGNVKLRDDKRPRPLVLRANVGDCLEITFQNLLNPTRVDNEQPLDRHAGIHVKGMTLVDSIDDDSSFVGRNESSLAAPGETRTYKLFAEHENGYLIENLGVPTGGEGAGGTTAFGLFGAINVEPFGSEWYRSQVTRDEMDRAATDETEDGQPILDYTAVDDDGLPILAMLDGNELVHSDLNAIITGPASNGYRHLRQGYPDTYWENKVYQGANLEQQRGEEPFREFTVIFHDEIAVKQAFDLFDHPNFEHALHGVRDGFAVNYGTGGIGAEIIGNRLGVGPMWDCVDCKYEEFFLTSWVVGDPAMIVDIPANTDCTDPETCVAGAKATKALYPDDPSNVHHSYLNDRVKYRNLHAGPAEHHIFHLHAHQWQHTPNTEKSSYLDSQLIGPGSGYTYEIAYGGSGNRNKTAGDSIFHCHFYPHFAQGMWELWRVHDTFERGTELDSDGRPRPGSRALPDGEIAAGTPIPGVVPMPTLPLAPMPDAAATVVGHDLNGDGALDSSQLDLDADGVADFQQTDDAGQGFAVEPERNPGFPFFIPGVTGHRPPTAPLDLVDANDDGQVEDGGLPRHMILEGEAESFETPYDFNKELLRAAPSYLPEDGTPAERVAMDFHAERFHGTTLPDGSPAPDGFETNGLPAVAGAPYAEPCRADDGGPIPRNRRYKGAVLQLDAVINKLGWHFPQQRIEALWDDVGDTLTAARPPEPLVMRLGVNDCADFWHTNLVPHAYELDDYQVRTPTDVIGQHIHLVKFDVVSADGSGNGFNYEDGTFSPQEVEERVHAIREDTNQEAPGTCTGDARLNEPGEQSTLDCPLARAHPFFSGVPGVGELAWGARTTMQRWYADPLLNDAWDQGLGSVFTHDHFGPSTHQQVGLYSTVLVEPEDSSWRDPETGTVYGSRHDGGPTSWRADIYWEGDDPRNTDAHREFYLELSDFQHAYQAGGGQLHMVDNGAGVMIPSYADHKNAINPSFRQRPPSGREQDLFFFPNRCPDGSPRPCPEAISADDVGTFVVNYRNEPVGLRVFDPATGGQATGARGDLARAYESRTDRAIAALNSQPAIYGTRRGVAPGDPFTPLLRVYGGDRVRFRTQVGGHEEQHNLTIHGVKWLQESMQPNSGWRNSQAGGISEYANMEIPILQNVGPGNPQEVDYRYTVNASVDGEWNGIWGLMRAYNARRNDLLTLPTNPVPAPQGPRRGWTIQNLSEFDQTCPVSAPVRRFQVTAVRAADVLGARGLVYNTRSTALRDADGVVQGAGPLQDPTGLLYVPNDQLVRDGQGRPVDLNGPQRPLVLRANAGDCIKLQLTNALPETVPELPGFNALPPIVHKDENVDGGGVVTFNANDLRPSSLVGLHPQLLQYDVRRNDGMIVGGGSGSVVAPGEDETYTWYAGSVHWEQVNATTVRLVARPVEYGTVGLSPADRIKGTSKGLAGALVIEPPGATWPADEANATSTTVTFPDGDEAGNPGTFREHVSVLHGDTSLRYGGQCSPTAANLQCAVPAIASEGGGVPEDPEDAGHRALNYRTEPLWFRLGVTPDTDFGVVRNSPDLHRVYSNTLIGGDPETPVFTAKPHESVRMRLVLPGGHTRGNVFTLNGHTWQREPYVVGVERPAQPCTTGAEATTTCGSDRLAWSYHGEFTELSGVPEGEMFGHQMVSWYASSQEGIGPSSHFDMIVNQAGGPTGTPGDYLFRDNAAFGNYQGLWGILRVEE